MNNREWLNKEVPAMANGELAEFFVHSEWCKESEECDGNCHKCMLEWLNKERIEPMPEIKDGMFIDVKSPYDDEICLGVVVGNRVIYQNGMCDAWQTGKEYDIETDWIVKIYDACSFNSCKDNCVIWEAKK